MEKSKNTRPIPDSVVKRVENLLLDGEELLLVAQPLRVRILLALPNVIGRMLSILGLLVAFGIVFALGKDAKSMQASCMLAALIGISPLAMLARDVWLNSTVEKHIYALTNKRVILIQPLFMGEQLKSFGGREITQLKIRPWRDGFDDLLFASESGGKGERTDIGFLGIPEVEEVRQLILESFEFNEDDFWSN